MNTNHMALPLSALLVLAAGPAFGQVSGLPRTSAAAPLAAAPAAPTVTILSAATGALIRNQGASTGTLDLGPMSYYKGTSAPGQTAQKNPKSFVISTRFALRVDCPGSAPSAKVNVTMARLDAASTHALTIDGTTVRSSPQTLLQFMACGSAGEHRLDVEVPISTPAGGIASNVAFVATLLK